MNFSDAAKVGSVIQQMKQVDLVRSTNRVLIQELVNGFPPFTQEEAAESGVKTNINFKFATNICLNARRHLDNATLKPQNFFNVSLDTGPAAKRATWSRIITKYLNRVLKRNWAFIQLVRSCNAAIILNGSATKVWLDKHRWLPDFVAIEDLMLPTDVETSLDNLVYFAIRREYTIGELWRMTHGEHIDPGWNVKAVEKVLDQYREYDTKMSSYTWSDSPEKLSELFKQNTAYYETDAAPTVTCWDFINIEDETDTPGWYRKVILDVNGPDTTTNEFLYDSKRVFARDIKHVLHITFGDSNNKPPFRYHSVRSLAWTIYDVAQMTNRLQCQYTDYIFENLMMLFRVSDPSDRDRVKKALLYNRGFLPEGLTIVPKDQRHQIDTEAVEALMSHYRQLMSESSTSFTQDIDQGTEKELTATETMARVNSSNSLLQSVLAMVYMQEEFVYREICRRFCLKNSTDPDCKSFRQRVIAEGVPETVLDPDKWTVDPEQVLGGGHKMLELAQAQQLMAVRNLHGPEAQQEILHAYDEAITDNPKLAERLAPIEAGHHVSDAVHDAELSFGTLMMGVPVSIKEGLNQIEEVETLLRLMAGVVQRIAQSGGVGKPEEVIGLQNVAQNIAGRVQLIAQDKQEKQRVKQYMQVLGRLMNMVKAFAQRQQQQGGNGHDPELIADIQKEQAITQQKLQSKEAAAQQRLRHNELKFRQQQQHDTAKTAAELQREHAKTTADLFSKSLTASVDAQAKRYAAFQGDDE